LPDLALVHEYILGVEQLQTPKVIVGQVQGHFAIFANDLQLQTLYHIPSAMSMTVAKFTISCYA
jgi:hypothetical protein